MAQARLIAPLPRFFELLRQELVVAGRVAIRASVLGYHRVKPPAASTLIPEFPSTSCVLLNHTNRVLCVCVSMYVCAITFTCLCAPLWLLCAPNAQTKKSCVVRSRRAVCSSIGWVEPRTSRRGHRLPKSSPVKDTSTSRSPPTSTTRSCSKCMCRSGIATARRRSTGSSTNPSRRSGTCTPRYEMVWLVCSGSRSVGGC